MLRCPHLEVRRTHPGFDGAERMLDSLTSQRDFGEVIVETLLNALKDVLVLPLSDAALLARGARCLIAQISRSTR